MIKKIIFTIIALISFINLSHGNQLSLNFKADLRPNTAVFKNSYDGISASSIVFKDVYINDMGRVWGRTFFYKNYLIVFEGDSFDEINLQIFKLEKDKVTRLSGING